jgi:hypothetical protein
MSDRAVSGVQVAARSSTSNMTALFTTLSRSSVSARSHRSTSSAVARLADRLGVG